MPRRFSGDRSRVRNRTRSKCRASAAYAAGARCVIDAAEDLKGEFLGRQINPDEQDRRERESQRMLLRHIDEDLIRERASELGETEATYPD